jgi:hypothetical protein
MNFVIRTQRVIEIAPIITRLEIRLNVLVTPELKNLNGYHNERAMPEYISKETRLSIILMLRKLP